MHTMNNVDFEQYFTFCSTSIIFLDVLDSKVLETDKKKVKKLLGITGVVTLML